MNTVYMPNPHRAEFQSVLSQTVDKWHNQLKRITNKWVPVYNETGVLVDNHPILHVEFKDGSPVDIKLDTAEAPKGTQPLQYSDNPQEAAWEGFVRSLINKHHTELKSFETSWTRLKNERGVVIDTQPAVDLVFKSAEDYAQDLANHAVGRHAQ